MAGRLRSEIKQNKPFKGVEQEAFLNLVRTADALLRSEEGLLKIADLSFTQYNLLRILRGAGSDGLPCRELSERMVTWSPDLTRLLDRLESRRLVARARDERDRRVIFTRITSEGLSLLKTLDAPICDLHRRQLGAIGAERLDQLIDLLEAIRETIQ